MATKELTLESVCVCCVWLVSDPPTPSNSDILCNTTYVNCGNFKMGVSVSCNTFLWLLRNLCWRDEPFLNLFNIIDIEMND